MIKQFKWFALLIAASLTILSTGCGADESEFSTEVSANFSFQADSGNPLKIRFTNESQNAQSYSWQFGDGGTSSSINPEHTYSNSGTFQVTLIAIGESGTSDRTQEVVVSGPADTSPPTVTSIVPERNSSGAASGTNIEALMSEAVNPSTVNTTNVRLFKDGGSQVQGAVSLSGNTIIFNPSVNLDFSTLHEFRISDVEDLAGNKLLLYTSRFTTGDAPDTTPPTVTAFSPQPGTSRIDINDVITITFSEPIASASASDNITVESADGNIGGNVSVSGNTVTFTPSEPLQEFRTNYTIVVSTGVTDLNGNNIQAEASSTFTTVTVDEGYYYRIIPFENYVNGANFNATLNMSQEQPVNIGNWSVCSNGCPGQLWSFEAISSTEYLITNEQNGPNYYLFSNQMDGTYGATGTPTNNQKWKLTEGVDLNVNGVSTWYELRNLAYPDRFYLSSLSLGISEINQDRYRNWGLVRIKAK